MTVNQLKYHELRENYRHNVASERENRRSNMAREAENFRTNVSNEDIKRATNRENYRHNVATEGETKRHNKISERTETVKAFGTAARGAGSLIQSATTLLPGPVGTVSRVTTPLWKTVDQKGNGYF